MKNAKKLLVLLLAIAMVVGLVGCTTDPTTPSNPSPSGDTEKPAVEPTGTLVISVEQGLEGKFSPFFYLSANDGTVVDFVSIGTFPVDRVGEPVLNGINGETRKYNGTDYTYYSACNVDVKQNEDGSVYYDITMREDMKFSDGTPVDIDDLIFSFYVYLDPSYDGSTTMYSVPIEGLESYRATKMSMILAAGEDNTDYSNWTEEEQTAFWADLRQAGAKFAQEIVDWLIGAGYNAEGETMDAYAANWGFSVPADGTTEDFFMVMLEDYGYDVNDLSNTESAGSSLFELMEHYDQWSALAHTGDSITGIQRTGDYSMRVVTTTFDATAIYQLGSYIAPLHYYGDESQYNIENNQFGFPKGDLSIVRAKTSEPLGAGPYTFTKYENSTVYLEANTGYYLGSPRIKYLNCLESSEDNKIPGLQAGTLDIADPSYDTEVAATIAEINGFEDWNQFDGPVLTTKLIDYRGYGYIGIAATRVKVGDDSSSDASKNLRKAIATVLAAYREEAIASYYGSTASVINYPISNTSWAAPQTTDDGYKTAYSVDVEGNAIYNAGMSTEERYAAAMQAALGYFEAAGYTVADGKLTAAPEGASLSYMVDIGAGGQGSHPSFLLLKNVSEAFETIGFTLTVNDIANSSELYSKYQSDQSDLWCAAWQAGTDPDMFQLYHSTGPSNYYKVFDSELDKLILQGRESADTTYRKTVYKAAMEIILDWGVEVPIYQRSDAVVVSSTHVKVDTLPKDMTPYWGWASEIEKLEVNS